MNKCEISNDTALQQARIQKKWCGRWGGVEDTLNTVWAISAARSGLGGGDRKIKSWPWGVGLGVELFFVCRFAISTIEPNML